MPLLDSSSYVSRTGHRWGAEHRADAEQRYLAAGPSSGYESDAAPAPIHTWPKGLYWALALGCALILALPALVHRIRRPAAQSDHALQL